MRIFSKFYISGFLFFEIYEHNICEKDPGIFLICLGIPASLSSNKLDDSCVRELSDFIINKQRKLHILDLSKNNITAKGCKELGRMLFRDSEILNIDLSHNSIGTEGFLEILKSLKKNMLTRKLHLNECQISKVMKFIFRHFPKR